MQVMVTYYHLLGKQRTQMTSQTAPEQDILNLH